VPGQIEAFTGSGLGYGTQVTATLGGVSAPVIYAGRSLVAGADQIQIQIPAGVSGCLVPLNLNIGAKTVYGPTVSISPDGSPCRQPFQLPSGDLATLDNGGSVLAAQLRLTSDLSVPATTAASRTEGISLEFTSADRTYLAGLSDATAPGCRIVTSVAYIAIGDFALGILSTRNSSKRPELAAGVGITLRNGATSMVLTSDSPNFYYVNLIQPPEGTLALPPTSFFPGGPWTLSFAGSADIPPSSFKFQLPSPILLNGSSPLTLRRDRDQTITWNGAAVDPSSTLNLTLKSAASAISCVAPASAGSLTVPADLLSSFSPASIGTVTAQIQPSPSALPYTLLRTSDGKTLLVFASFSSSDSRPVDFQ
jgi:hypothetical protein